MPELSFVVDSALLSELGERLVETVHIALGELIKNSYDADATEVKVNLLSNDTSDVVIGVSDNGTGMTFQDVKKYWMRIATTNKALNNVSPQFGRPKTGSKGIGRFSCRRLGTTLELITTAKKNGRYETTQVKFNWKEYKPGTDVTKIICQGKTRTSKEGQTGTKLLINGGDDAEWNKRSWNALKRQMTTLVANRGTRRKRFKEDPGFSVQFIAPMFEDSLTVNLRDQLMNSGWGRLGIVVNKEGKLQCTLHAKKLGKKQITHTESFPELAGTSADIAILPDNRSQFRDTSVLSLGNLRSILEDWGGIFIRHRNARVYPYGESGSDWLNIDRDRGLRLGTRNNVLKQFAKKLEGVKPGRELLNMLSSRSYVGEIDIATPNPYLFEMKASREGFVGTRGISKLREVIRFGIDWSTVWRDYYLKLEAREETERVRQEFIKAADQKDVEPEQTIEKAVEYVKREVRQITSHLPKEEKDIGRTFTKATDLILKSDKTTRDELQHLRLVASTSSLLLIFSHEVKSLLGNIEEHSASLNIVRKQVTGKAAQILERMNENLANTKKRFYDLLSMTSLISVDSKHAVPQKLALADKVDKAIDCYRLIMNKYDIKIESNQVPRTLQTGKMLEAELFAILLNVLSNSIKSIIAKGREKKIAIKACKDQGGTKISVFDTGLGIDLKSADELFVPFNSDPSNVMYPALRKRLNPEDEYIVGTGSGLGLSIAREIVRARKGHIRFCDSGKDWNANLEILLP